jgi:hypothetical protein
MPERFSWLKLAKSFLRLLEWIKSQVHIVRGSFLIVLIVLVTLYGIGYWKGKKSKPVIINEQDSKFILRNHDNKEHTLEFKQGKMYFDEKLVREGQLEGHRPYGFNFQPKTLIGYPSEYGLGIGAKVAYFYEAELDCFIIPYYIGIGASFNPKLKRIKNTSFGLGFGYNMDEKDSAIIGYVGWKW